MASDKQPTHTERLATALVFLITVAFGVTTSALLWAKWRNFDPFLLDFARGTRVYEGLLQRVPYDYSMHYYLFFYMGIYPILLPLYALFRSIILIFAVHVGSFTLAIPLLYLISRQMLSGVALPLAVVIIYALNPTIDVTALGFMRLEGPWMILFLLTVYLTNKKSYGAALWCAVGACLVRIDAAPAIFLQGLVYVVNKKKPIGFALMRRSVLVMAIMLAGLILFRLATRIPLSYEQFHMTTILSDQDPSMAKFFWGVATTLLDPDSYGYFQVLAQFLLIPLLAPLYLLPMVFSSLYVVLSSESFLSNQLVSSLLRPNTFLVPFLHVHDTYIFPILFVATIAGIRRLCVLTHAHRNMLQEKSSLLRAGLAVILIVSFSILHWFGAPPALGPVPLTPAFNKDYYRATPHSRLAWQILRIVPKDQPGIMQGCFADRAYRLTHIRELFPQTRFEPTMEYALFDLFAFSAHMPKKDLLTRIEQLLATNDMQVHYFGDGILLLRRGPSNEDTGKVRDYILFNRDRLSLNLTSPYKHGPLSREQALDKAFSETMLPVPKR